MLDFDKNDAVNTSETLMFYILNEKIIGRKYDGTVEYKTDENGNEVKVKKNFIPIITLETGRSRDKDRLLN